MKKDQKLTLEEQIEDLKSKNIQFDEESDSANGLMTINDAQKFLRYNTFYFHFKHYAHAFEINKDEREKTGAIKYVNLSFGKMVELSKLDMYFRRIVLHMCLDVEHLLKTRLIYDITINDKEDGKRIVGKYINTLKNGYKDYVDMKLKHKDSILAKLVAKFPENQEDLQAWKFVEILSFGQFIDFYKFYYDEYNERNAHNGIPTFAKYLDDIRFLRNAAAHNSGLLSDIKSETEIEPTNNIVNIICDYKKKQKAINPSVDNGIDNSIDKRRLFEGIDASKQLSNHVVHDFVTLLFVYRDLLKHSLDGGMYCRSMEEVDALFNSESGRMVLHKEMFTKDKKLIQSYLFIVDVLEYIKRCNSSYRKSKKWIIKYN